MADRHNPAEVAWALALERGQFDPMEELLHGLTAMQVKFEFRASPAGKPE